MTHELNAKAAIVTGASHGIGAAAARALARYGVRVVAVARGQAELDGLVEEIRNSGGTAVAVRCDVSIYSDVKAVVRTCIDEYGKLDILINNAGVIEPIARLADSEPEQWGRIVDVNFKGVYHGLHAAIPVMQQQGGGVIVNLSSGAATSALEGWSHYCSTKAAVLSLTKCADKEYREKGIRVVGLSPGTVATQMQVAIKGSGINPVSRLDMSAHIPAEWVGRAIAWLCTDAARDLAGTDFSLKDDAGRRRVGLIK